MRFSETQEIAMREMTHGRTYRGRSQGGNLEMKLGVYEAQVTSDGSRNQVKFSVTSGCVTWPHKENLFIVLINDKTGFN